MGKKKASVNVNGLTNPQFLMLVQIAAENLEWKLLARHDNMLVYKTIQAAEKITVHIIDGFAEIVSRSTSYSLINRNRNKENVESLTEQINVLQSQYAAEALTDLEEKRRQMKKNITLISKSVC
jgi:hypothetical protein